MSDGTRTYTWQHGRQMATVTQNGETWVNTYNADGLLVKCSSDRLTYTYVYNGSQLTQVSVGGETMRFIYDESGVPMILQHNGQNYYYVTNPQGDVLAIVDSNGYAVATYLYDPWGKVLDYTVEGDGVIGSVNPFRYRGYIYNLDTELYYLQSRYYDPALRRFLNADAFVSTGQGLLSNNMFVYCLNNPVNREDATGMISLVNERDLLGAYAGALWFPGMFLIESIVELFTSGSTTHKMTIADELVKEEEKVESQASTTVKKREPAIYYGVDLYGGSHTYRTGPMTYVQAVAWVAEQVEHQTYSDRQSWGLITEKKADAVKIAITLGPIDQYGAVSHDPARAHRLPHVHTVNRCIGGVCARRFHVWYTHE